jgi:hypothetical protein
MTYPLYLEEQAPTSHIYGALCMSVVETISRKSTRKVGPSCFDPTMPQI